MTDASSEVAVLRIDDAAAEIRKRADAWAATGLAVGPMTWHEARSAPPQIVSDRNAVRAPDSVGVTIGKETGPYARVVLYHYGWVDLDVVNWATFPQPQGHRFGASKSLHHFSTTSTRGSSPDS